MDCGVTWGISVNELHFTRMCDTSLRYGAPISFCSQAIESWHLEFSEQSVLAPLHAAAFIINHSRSYYDNGPCSNCAQDIVGTLSLIASVRNKHVSQGSGTETSLHCQRHSRQGYGRGEGMKLRRRVAVRIVIYCTVIYCIIHCMRYAARNKELR